MASGLRVRCSFSSSNYLYSNLTTSFGLSRASQHQSQTARPLMSASSPVQVAVVTGANKGIGFEICKQLVSKGVKTILACRNEELGLKAVDNLKAIGLTSAEFRQCDISSSSSVDRFISSLQTEYSYIDILVNNAAIAYKGSDPTPFAEQTEPTLHVNFFSTVEFTRKMIPFLRAAPYPRVVNVASMAGHLSILKNPSLVSQFTSPTLNGDELELLMKQFIMDVSSGTHQKNGWPNSNYGMSKLGLIAFTKVLAREETNIAVNACCPGYCATDMSSHRGPRSPEEGAKTPVFLALLPPGPNCPTGQFFKDSIAVEW